MKRIKIDHAAIRTVVYDGREYKWCPLCGSRYLMRDLDHLDRPHCQLLSVTRQLHAQGFRRCGNGHAVCRAVGVAFKAPGYVAHDYDHKARVDRWELLSQWWAPAWAVAVSNQHIPAPLRKWWVFKLAQDPDAAAAAMAVYELADYRSAALMDHLSVTVGAPTWQSDPAQRLVRRSRRTLLAATGGPRFQTNPLPLQPAGSLTTGDR